MLPRDRVANLLDTVIFFWEVGLFAANGEYKDEVPSAGAIAGVGLVSKRLCMIICNDATVKGGSYYPLTVKKHLRGQEIAAKIIFPASILSIVVVQIYLLGITYSPIKTILDEYSSIRLK